MFNDCEPPKKKVDGFKIFVIAFFILSAILLCGIIGYGISEEVNKKEYNDWYNSLSAEEKANEDTKKQEEYNKKVTSFEVLNLSQYVQNITNGFGGIVRTEIKYTFSYINENGKLVHVDSWDPANVEIGSETKLVQDKNIGGGITLVVDKETFNNIPTLTNG